MKICLIGQNLTNLILANDFEEKKLKVDILGKMYEATILEEGPYDVENKLLRA